MKSPGVTHIRGFFLLKNSYFEEKIDQKPTLVA